MTSPQEELLDTYDNCIKSRYLDELLQRIFHAYHTRSIFSGIGAEIGPSIVTKLLRHDDYLIPRFRGVAAILGKGISIERVVAEILERKTGTAKGVGDASPFRDPSCGIPGYSISLGGMFAVALGLAFAVKFKKEERVVVQFFGDGEASRPTFGSALNLASLWQLPILFVCENNGISISTRIDEMSTTKTIAERAKGYNTGGETISETDVIYLHERAKTIIAQVRLTRRP